MTINTIPISPLGNSLLSKTSSYGGWDSSAVSLPAQKPIPQYGKEFTGINFLGSNGLSNIHNADAVKSTTPLMRTGTTPTFSAAGTTSSPFHLNAETFTNAWGGGGPLMGNVVIAV